MLQSSRVMQNELEKIETENNMPVITTVLNLLYFLYNNGKNNPIGTNKTMFNIVSIGPVIIPTKGIKEILGLKDMVLV